MSDNSTYEQTYFIDQVNNFIKKIKKKKNIIFLKKILK
jgi:hypothetical protein